jgi:AraC family transcriptional regulator of adaptative response/methylated-DNA-[protein]-cysteine methyltransferase
MNLDECWQAVLTKDSSHDGAFVFAVATTGVYCRPSCPSRRPRRENTSFYKSCEAAERAGFRACVRCRPKSMESRSARLVRSICRYIEQHLDDPITLALLSAEFEMSPFHLQRVFKKALGVSPKQYADSCRMKLLKQRLQEGHNVTRALYDAGYSSSSRLYERTSSQLGMTPDKYRRGAVAANIRYTCVESPLGRMLLAATDRGVCAVHFAATDEELVQGLQREFPFALRKQDDDGLLPWVNDLLATLDGQKLNRNLPLDIQATAFQRRVWDYLRSVPRGTTRSYQQVAQAIGQPSAARAVARACATNPVAVAIPCHRVVREGGELGGYRWGMERKRTLLAMESRSSSRQSR